MKILLSQQFYWVGTMCKLRSIQLYHNCPRKCTTTAKTIRIINNAPGVYCSGGGGGIEMGEYGKDMYVANVPWRIHTCMNMEVASI